ncbi:formate dehydrogenase accessory protein FdhE, partial [Escherichia coli]
IKAESCEDCDTYLNILYQEKAPKIEAVADDLASLGLGARMEDEGYARRSINPFLFPGEGEKSLPFSGSRRSPGLQPVSKTH